MDGFNKAKAAGVRFGPKPILTLPVIEKIKALRADGATVPEIMRRTKLAKPVSIGHLGVQRVSEVGYRIAKFASPLWSRSATRLVARKR